MATKARIALDRALAGFTRDYRGLARALNGQIGATLARHATGGSIPPAQRGRALSDVGTLVTRFYAGDSGPFRPGADGTDAVPASPYAQALGYWLAQATLGAVETHQALMRRYVRAEALWRWLETAQRPITGADGVVSEQEDEDALRRIAQDLRIFHPNPLAELDVNRRWVPFLRWQGSDGYRLSDRIWQTGEDARTKVNRVLLRGLNEGRSAVDLANLLEPYLLPREQGRRTAAPYGAQWMQPGGVAAAAMRLARTEITAAHARASFAAAVINPYVGGMDWARSGNGDPTCPICAEHATIGFAGERLRPPYPMTGALLPPGHPHCKCVPLPVVIDDPQTVTERLRAALEADRRDILDPALNPADAQRFANALLGGALNMLLGQRSAIEAAQMALWMMAG